MAQQSLQEQQVARRNQIDLNRELGVIDYKSGDRKSDRVYEVTEGYKYLPGGIRLGPGQRFRPTERQVANGSLRGKARELTRTELVGIGRTERKPVSAGADIGLRQFEMADSTREFARDHDLTEEDFRAAEPEGANGRFTRAQVEGMAEAKAAGSPDAA